MRWLRRKDHERDLEREIRADLELEAAEQQENGLTPQQTRYAARRAFGNTALVIEDVRSMWRWISVERFAHDLRYALRSAYREPGFAIVAVLTLALGIGINTAVFSIVNAVLLRKPSYAYPERLVSLRQNFPKIGDLVMGCSPAQYLDYAARSRAFSSVSGHEDAVFDLTGDTEPVRVEAQRVTHTLFATLTVAPLVGRTFSAEEDQPGGARVAVVSYEFAQRQFGGVAKAAGDTIRLDEQPYTVIGVMPPGFEFPFTAASVGEPPALWVPMAFTPSQLENPVGEFPVHVVARLRPGVSLAQAEQDVKRVAREFQSERPGIYSGNLRLEVDLDPLGAREAARARPVLLALAGAVIFVLLIACANVMNLLAARAVVRQREMALRGALGASVGRLVAQLLTESLLLAGVGAVLGCGVAQAIIRTVATLWPSFVAGLQQVRLDPTVLGFTLAVSVITGLTCGLAPSFTGRRLDIAGALKQGGRQGGSHLSHGMRSTLVVLEAASAVLLLIAAGLLVHSLVEVLRVPPGFSPNGVLIARTTFNRRRYPSGEIRRTAERRMVERIAALPGVAAVGLTTHIPLADERQIAFLLEGEDVRAARWADNALVSGEYFAAMGISIVQGRTFERTDTPQGPVAAITNASMARRFWPHGDAIGKRLVWGGRNMTIVGVAGDVHIKALDAAVNPTIYTCVYQVQSAATTSAVFIVRSRGTEPAELAGAVREAIWSVDRGVPVFDIRTMEQVVARSLTARRFAVALLAAFALLALALAVVGLYGVLSYAVTQRTSELGIRLALGATPGEVLRLVVGDGLRLTTIGIGMGALLGAAAARAMSRLLFGIQTFDIRTFAIAAAVLMTVALIASYVPARRASRVDPTTALRNE
jgi:predicted permease